PVAAQQVLVEARRPLGVQQLLDDRLVAFRAVLLELGVGRPEPGATQQVSHQLQVVLGHALLLAWALSADPAILPPRAGRPRRRPPRRPRPGRRRSTSPTSSGAKTSAG